MTRTVADAAVLLAVMAEPTVRWDGIDSLETTPKGLRLGVLPPPASTHPEVLSQSKEWFKLLEHEGFALIDVPSPPGWATLLDEELEVLKYDFKAEINAYLERFQGTLPVRTLADLIKLQRTTCGDRDAVLRPGIVRAIRGLRPAHQPGLPQGAASHRRRR